MRLSCLVKANTAEIRWFKDGKLIVESQKYMIKKFRYLRIKDIEKSDQGVYICNASNSEGYVTKIVHLNVIPGMCRYMILYVKTLSINC